MIPSSPSFLTPVASAAAGVTTERNTSCHAGGGPLGGDGAFHSPVTDPLPPFSGAGEVLSLAVTTTATNERRQQWLPPPGPRA